MSRPFSFPTIQFTNDYEYACALTQEGLEPIECAFGGHGSVLGPLAMDHHGEESHREGVAIRACRDLYGACADGPGFVVTGTPDADAVLAIVALAGLIPRDAIPEGFPELVDRHDRNPIGINLAVETHGPLLLAFNQTSLPTGLEGFQQGIQALCLLLSEGHSAEELERLIKTELARQRRASEAYEDLYGPGGTPLPGPTKLEGMSAPTAVALVCGSVWGFDVWYQWAPVVVSYSTRLKKITLGCPNDETAIALFGPRGLLDVYPLLGTGWGGREAIGGSPRGVPKTLEDAREVAMAIANMLPVE